MSVMDVLVLSWTLSIGQSVCYRVVFFNLRGFPQSEPKTKKRILNFVIIALKLINGILKVFLGCFKELKNLAMG